MEKRERKKRFRWRRWMAGGIAVILAIAMLPWSLFAKTESVVSVRGESGYTEINWEKAAFLDGGSYQVLNMEFHTTNEGNPTYCLQQNIGNPTDQEIDYAEGSADGTFSPQALAAVNRILRNGYPMNEEMWEIPPQGQREATQIAVWYVMSHFSQPGSAANGAPSSFSIILDNDCIRNATEYDVVGMARALIRCGLAGEDLFSPALSVKETSVTERDGSFEVVYEIETRDISCIAGELEGIAGEYEVLWDGRLLEDAFEVASPSEKGELTVRMDAFSNREREIGLLLEGKDRRDPAGIFFLNPTGAYQKMAGVRMNLYKVTEVAEKTELPAYTPPDTKIRIVKKDADTDTPLEGAVFQVFRMEEVRKEDGWENCEPLVITAEGEKMMITDEEGCAVTVPLPFGSYLVVETEAPEGYLISEPQEVTFSGKGEEMVSLTVYDRLFRVSLQVQKKDGVTGADICQGGVMYELLDENKMPLDLGQGSRFETDEEGNFEIPYELPSGTYYLKEIQPPAGYAAQEEETEIRITCGQVTVIRKGEVSYGIVRALQEEERCCFLAELEAEDEPILLEIAKKGEGFGLSGAALVLSAKEDIFGQDGSVIYREGDVVREWISEPEGEIFYGIPAGHYVLEEKEAPMGYVRETEGLDILVEDTAKPQYAEMVNHREEFAVEVQKTDEEGLPLEGVLFELQYGETIVDEQGTTVFEEGQAVLAKDGNPILLLTGPEGKARAEGLWGWIYKDGVPGQKIVYQLQEVKTGKGYVLDPEPMLLTEDSWDNREKTWKVEWENERQKGRIRIRKVGDVASYPVGYPSEFGEIYEEVSEEMSLPQAEFTVFEDEEGEVMLEQIITDEEGWAETGLLPAGIYYVKETGTPKGYLPDDRIHAIEIAGDETGAEEVSDTEILIQNEPCTVTVSFCKRGKAKNEQGEWEKFLLSDAVFGFYQGEKLLQTAVSGDDGMVVFAGTYPEGIYHIRELVAPDGFGRLDESMDVTVEKGNEDLDIRLEDVLFENDAVTGKLTLEKAGGDGLPLAGVEFTLTNKETKDTIKKVTDEAGVAEWTGLPAGYRNREGEFLYYHYELEETGTPEGYLGWTEKKEIVFDQENNGQQVVAIRTRIVNYEESLPLILGTRTIPLWASLLMIAAGALSGVIFYHVKKRWKK